MLGNSIMYATGVPIPTVTSFTSAGTTTWTAPSGVTSVSYLIVGGGGGGAGGVGASSPGSDVPGTGGVGLENSITGTPIFYAGGGGGGTRSGSYYNGNGGLGGNGGGGQGGGGQGSQGLQGLQGLQGGGGQGSQGLQGETVNGQGFVCKVPFGYIQRSGDTQPVLRSFQCVTNTMDGQRVRLLDNQVLHGLFPVCQG